MNCSIIVPVLNETASINYLIDYIHTLEGDEEPEIIIVDGDPEGSTLAAIRSDDVRKIMSPKGRGRQMNEGAKNAKGNILLFLHADTELPPEALMRIAKVMQDDRYVGGAFDLGIKSGRFIFRLIARVASFRSRVTGIPFGDQAIFIRKNYFEKIDGYKDIPLMEDVEIMQRIQRKGDIIFIIRKKVFTSPRRWEKEGVLRCMLRNWLIQLLYYLGVSPYMLTKFYRHS